MPTFMETLSADIGDGPLSAELLGNTISYSVNGAAAVEFAAMVGLKPGFHRRGACAHSAPSKASSQRLTSSSQPSCALANPPSPLAAVTR